MSLGNLCGSLVLTGDLNVCLLSLTFARLQAICEIAELIQIIDSPTHGAKVIDHIFVHKSATIIAKGTDLPVEKLHALTWVKLRSSPTRAAPARPLT